MISRVANEPARKYDAAEQQRSLMTLAFCNGNAKRAAKALANDVGVSRRQLTRWRDEHRKDYEQIRRDIMPAIREQAAESLMETVDELSDLESNLIQRNKAAVNKLRPAELSGALRNASVSKGINLDKAKDLRESDAPPEPTRTFEQDIAFLRRHMPRDQLKALFGLDDEVVDATVVEPEQDDPVQLVEPEPKTTNGPTAK